MRTAQRVILRGLEAVIRREVDAVTLTSPPIVAANGVGNDRGPPSEAPLFRILQILGASAPRGAFDMLDELLKRHFAIVAGESQVHVGQRQQQNGPGEECGNVPGTSAARPRDNRDEECNRKGEKAAATQGSEGDASREESDSRSLNLSSQPHRHERRRSSQMHEEVSGLCVNDRDTGAGPHWNADSNPARQIVEQNGREPNQWRSN